MYDSVVYFVIGQFLLKCDTNSSGLGAEIPRRCRRQESVQKHQDVVFFLKLATVSFMWKRSYYSEGSLSG